jgi:hypothetical protein
MKPYYLIIALLIVFCCSKENADDQSAESADAEVRDTAYFALNLDSAKSFTERYRKMAKEVLKDTVPVKAFTVRAKDLLEALGIKKAKPKFEYVRVYLGLDDQDKFRLMLTPVVDADFKKGHAGKDVILSGPFKPGDKYKAGESASANGEYVLDFNMPCPNTCDTGSPLE